MRDLAVFVLGTGRSGTSSVARILHEDLGVFMGRWFKDPDWTNPDGFYEDLFLKNANDHFMRGLLSFPDWEKVVREHIRCRPPVSGLKDPRLCRVIGLWIQEVENPLLIHCKRSREMVVRSFIEKYQWAPEQAEAEVTQRTRLLDRALRNLEVYELNFDQQLSDQDIRSFLEDALDRGRARNSSQ